MKTCVLPFRRRNGFECRIRSRSRWNGVRTPHSSSGRARPRVSYERTASGESDVLLQLADRAANEGVGNSPGDLGHRSQRSCGPADAASRLAERVSLR